MTSERLRRAGTCLALALVLIAAAESTAPAQQVVDQGAFTLYQNGVRVGEERFMIREERRGGGRVLLIGGELNLKTDGTTARTRVAVEADPGTLSPLRYEAEFDGSRAVQIHGLTNRDRLRLTIRSPEGERIQQFLPGASWVILEDRIAHHYYLAVRLLGDGDRTTATATAIVPRERRQITIRIEDRGQETTEVAGRQMQLRHVTVGPEGGPVRHIWLDGGRLMKVEIPEVSWKAVRG